LPGTIEQPIPFLNRRLSSFLQNAASLLPACIAGGAFLFASFLFYPGFMSYDSLYQYKQVLGDAPLANLHPVIMIYLWRLTNYFITGPGGLLLLHQLIYWLSIFLFACFLSCTWWKRTLLILTIGFFPPTFMLSLHIWKDTGLMVAFMMTAALILWAKKTQRNAYTVLSLPFLFYGLAIRHNSILAVLPLIFLLSEIYVDNAGTIVKSSQRKAVLGAAVLIILVSISYFINTYHVEKEDPWGIVMPWDLAAISVYRNQFEMPNYLVIDEGDSPQDTFNKIKAHFHPHRNYSLDPVIRTATSPQLAKQLKNDWYRIVCNNPGAYLYHRWIVSRHLFGFFTKVYYASHNAIDENPYGFHLYRANSELYRRIVNRSAAFENTIFYKAWMFILISALIAGGIAFTGRYSAHVLLKSSMLLAASAFFYALPLVVLAPCCDFRYNSWLIMGAIMSFFPAAKWLREIWGNSRQNKHLPFSRTPGKC
jgi:hypothetical protein